MKYPFRITVDKVRFAAAAETLPELYVGGVAHVMCNCASTPPTMPTCRATHLDTCPARFLEGMP